MPIELGSIQTFGTWHTLNHEDKVKLWQEMTPKDRENLWNMFQKNKPEVLKELDALDLAEAKRYFSEEKTDEDVQKLSRKEGKTRNSYIMIKGTSEQEDKVYRLSLDKMSSDESTRVKTIQKEQSQDQSEDRMSVETDQGENLVVKILTNPDPELLKNEIEALRKMNDLVDVITRQSSDGEKTYIIMKEKPGMELFEIHEKLAKKGINLTPAQNAILAIKCCQVILKAHQHGIIHGDISPTNFKIDITRTAKGDIHIEVNLIDFGNAKILDPGQTEITGQKAIRTKNYAAPLVAIGTYSFSTDDFALRQMLHDDVEIFSGLLDKNASTTEMMTKIIEDLEKRSQAHEITIDEESQQAMETAKSELSAQKEKAVTSSVSASAPKPLDEDLFKNITLAINKYKQTAALFPSGEKEEISVELNSILKLLKSINNPNENTFLQRQVMLTSLLEKVASGKQKGLNHPTVVIIIDAIIRDYGLKQHIEFIKDAKQKVLREAQNLKPPPKHKR